MKNPLGLTPEEMTVINERMRQNRHDRWQPIRERANRYQRPGKEDWAYRPPPKKPVVSREDRQRRIAQLEAEVERLKGFLK